MPIEVAVDIIRGMASAAGQWFLIEETAPGTGRFELRIGRTVWRGWEWN